MNETECGIALKLVIYDNANGVKVIYLVKRSAEGIHLTVKTVYRLDSALEREMNTVFHELFGKLVFRIVKEITADAVFLLDRLLDLGLAYGVKIV